MLSSSKPQQVVLTHPRKPSKVNVQVKDTIDLQIGEGRSRKNTLVKVNGEVPEINPSTRFRLLKIFFVLTCLMDIVHWAYLVRDDTYANPNSWRFYKKFKGLELNYLVARMFADIFTCVLGLGAAMWTRKPLLTLPCTTIQLLFLLIRAAVWSVRGYNRVLEKTHATSEDKIFVVCEFAFPATWMLLSFLIVRKCNVLADKNKDLLLSKLKLLREEITSSTAMTMGESTKYTLVTDILVILFYSVYTMILITASVYLFIFFSAIHSFRPKNQIPSVYIYIMILCNAGSIFIELTTDTIPILLSKKQNKWVYSNIGEYLTLLDSFVYAYPMLLTSIMTCERLYVTFFPTGTAFSNNLIWCYSLLVAIFLLVIILIPFFSECTLNFDFYTIAYTTTCNDEDHYLTYLLDTYTALIPITCMVLNIMLIVHLFFKRRQFIQQRMDRLSRMRQSHEKTLMVQSIATTTFLLLYDFTGRVTDLMEQEYSKLPPLAQRAIYYSRTSCVVFTCFFIYFVGTPSIRRITIRKVSVLIGRRKNTGKTILVATHSFVPTKSSH